MGTVLIDEFKAAVLAGDERVAAGDECFFQDEVLIGRAADTRGIEVDGEGVLAVEIHVVQGWRCWWNGHHADSIL